MKRRGKQTQAISSHQGDERRKPSANKVSSDGTVATVNMSDEQGDHAESIQSFPHRTVKDNGELCLLNGIAASAGSAILGWVIGFGGAALNPRKQQGRRFRSAVTKAKTSAKTFAQMGGVYTFVACATKKIRGVDDATNLAIAGCASGLVLGWDGGPFSALQSCATMGAFSWYFDGKRPPH